MQRSPARYFRPALLLLFAFVLLISVFIGYYMRISQSLDRQTSSDLLERASQTAKVFQIKLDDSFAYLESVAGVVASFDSLHSPEVRRYLTQQDSDNLFENYLVALPDGTAMSGSGETYSLRSSKTFETALKGSSAVSGPSESIVSGNRGVSLCVPILRGNEVAGVLQCDYRIELLKQLLDSQIYSGQGMANIITSNGIMVTNSAALDGYPSYFEALKDVQFAGDMTLEAFQEDLNQGKSGILEFTYRGKKRYVVYVPVGRNDWYTIASISEEVVNQQARNLSKYGIILAGEVILIQLGLVVYFALMQQKDKKHIRRRERELSSLISNIPGGVCKYRPDEGLSICYTSPSFRTFLGYQEEQMPVQLAALIDPRDLGEVQSQLNSQLKNVSSYAWEHRMVHRSGVVLWFLQRGQLLIENGERFLYSVFVDITGQKQIRQQLEISDQRYRAVLDRSDSVIFELNLETGRAVFSDVWEKKFGYPPVEEDFLRNVVREQIVHPDDVHKNQMLYQRASGDEKYNEEIIRLRQGSGRYIWCSVGLTSISPSGAPSRVVGVIKDVDKEQRRVRRMQSEVQRDALTGLYNKKFVQKKIEEYLQGEGSNEPHAFFMIDIDRFKEINDTLGHLKGDAVITEFAQRLRSPLSSSDFIGRIGGDEFGVLVKNICSKELAEQKANEIIREAHHLQTGQGIPLSCSIGISLYRVDGLTYGELYHKADTALYQAKRAGRDRACFYGARMQPESESFAPGVREE